MFTPSDGGVASTTTSLFISAFQPGVGINNAQTVITIAGVIAYSGGSAQNGYVVNLLPVADGIEYDIIPPAPFAVGNVAVQVTAEDNNTNSDTQNFSFTASAGPVHVMTNPTDGQNDVAVDTTITLETTASGGIQASTVFIQVESNIVWQSEAAQNGYGVVVTPITDGFRYVITPPSNLPNGNPIPIYIEAQDNSFIFSSANFSFNTEALAAPELNFVAINPTQEQSGVPADTDIVLDATANLGLDANETTLTVNGVIAWQNGSPQNGYAGSTSPITDGLRYTLTPPADLPAGTTNVQVDIQDTFANGLISGYTFDVGSLSSALFNPADGAVGVDPATSVIVDIVALAGLNEPETVITIGGVVAWQGGALQNAFTGGTSAITNGLRYSLQPPSNLAPGAVSVAVQAQDNGALSINDNYSFSVADPSTSLLISPISPTPGQEGVLEESAVNFKITSGAAVSLDNTRVFVRDALVYAGVQEGFAPGWASSTVQSNNENGFDFFLVPDLAFQWLAGETVKVAVTTRDSAENTAALEWFFVAEGNAFTFQVHKFVIQSIIEMDKRSPGLIELMSSLPGGLTDTWRTKIIDRVCALYDLQDPREIPDQWLPWLGGQLGFGRNLVFNATEDELRILYENAMRYWNNKPAELALKDAVRIVTGNRFSLRNYFDFRMMIIDPVDNPNLEEATFVTELLEDFDPDVIDFPTVTPSGSKFRWFGPIGADTFPPSHTFFIQDLPEQYFPGGVFRSEDEYLYVQIVSFPNDPSFEGFYKIQQLNVGAQSGIVDANGVGGEGVTGDGEWRLWAGNSDHISELRLVDEPANQINKQLLRTLIDQVRAHGERIDIVYLAFLDRFYEKGDHGQWTETGGASDADNSGFVTMEPAAILDVNKTFASDWEDRNVLFKFLIQDGLAPALRLHALYSDPDNSYLVQVEPTSKLLSLRKRIGAVESTLASVTIPEMAAGQIESVRVHVIQIPSGVFIRVKFDGDEFIEYTDTADPFPQGSVRIESTAGTSQIYTVEVMTLPVTTERVGPLV